MPFIPISVCPKEVVAEPGELDFKSPHFVYLDLLRRSGGNHPETVAYAKAHWDYPQFNEIAAHHRLLLRLLDIQKIESLENVGGAGI